MKIADLSDRVEEAAKWPDSVIYLDTSIIDGITERNEQEEANNDVVPRNWIEQIIKGKVNSLESAQMLAERIQILQNFRRLLQTYPNIVIIKQVAEELERESKIASYAPESIRRQVRIRGFDRVTKEGRHWKEPGKTKEEPLDDESTRDIQATGHLADIFWKELNKIRNLHRTNGLAGYTEKQKQIYQEVLNILAPSLSDSHWKEGGKQKYGHTLLTDENLVAYVIAELFGPNIQKAYVATGDINLMTRASGIVEGIKRNTICPETEKFGLITNFDISQLRYNPASREKLEKLISVINQN